MRWWLMLWIGVGVFWGVNVKAAELNYIYIEANEGNSSGGHGAVQLGNDVFHYQYVDEGLIRLIKHSADDFEFNYRIVENRGLHIQTLQISEDRYAQLRHFFKQQYAIQNQQFALKNDTQRNHRLLRLLRNPVLKHESTWSVPGASLFYTLSDFLPFNPFAQPLQHSDVGVTFELGVIDLNVLIRQVITEIEQLKPDLKNTVNPLQADQFPARPYSFASRYSDLLTGLLAVYAVQHQLPLQQSLIDTKQFGFTPLTATERKILTLWQEQLKNSIIDLLRRTRPDWGYAVFINYARWLAVERSLKTGYWQVMNTFEPDAISTEQPVHSDYEHLSPIIHELKAQLESMRVQWAEFSISESGYSRLEYQFNRYQEWFRAYEDQIPPRLHSETLLPQARLSLPLIIKPQINAQQLAVAEQISEQSQQQIENQLQTLYAYHLLTRNCVTEIWRVFDQLEFSSAQEAILDQSVASALAFIPKASQWSIQQQRTVKQIDLPSFRRQQLDRMYDQEGLAPVFFRENNTFSATRYYRNPKDSFFIFFTDQTLILRPVYGAFNILASLGQILFGGFNWPQDQGYHLQAGLKGILMSVPELFFVNLRKGSYPYISHQDIIPVD